MSFEAAFYRLHRSLMPEYEAHCILVAEQVAELLHNHRKPASFLRFWPAMRGQLLVPRTAPHLKWIQHYVCTSGLAPVTVYDPMLPRPQELQHYARATFRQAVEWEPTDAAGRCRVNVLD